MKWEGKRNPRERESDGGGLLGNYRHRCVGGPLLVFGGSTVAAVVALRQESGLNSSGSDRSVASTRSLARPAILLLVGSSRTHPSPPIRRRVIQQRHHRLGLSNRDTNV